MTFHIYNTMTRSKEVFSPIDGKIVRMYTCGPTVYNYAHIGNFRAYVFEDLLRRHIKFCGYKVVQVQNLTDVDDKTIQGSINEGKSLKEFTSKYIKAFHDDLKILNIEPAEHYPAATDYISEMIEMIKKLIELDYAYKSDDGSVYYRIDKFEKYGNLAKLDREGMKPGQRTDSDEYEKDNLCDFALWKGYTENDGEVYWDSPWGKGRPGWHIECSAMSTTILGESFDLHCGGVDNICPHHENEIAQSEAISGKQYSKYWMHCNYLIVDGKKMSKSLGNFYTLSDLFKKGYTGREIRYELISTHYRQSLNFTLKSLNSNKSSLNRLDEFYYKIKDLSSIDEEIILPEWINQLKTKFIKEMNDDMNISGALAAIFEIVNIGNRYLVNGEVKKEHANGILELWSLFDNVLGFLIPNDDSIPNEINEIANKRLLARKEKNWDASDQYRDEIFNLGWSIKDSKDGYELRKL